MWLSTLNGNGKKKQIEFTDREFRFLALTVLDKTYVKAYRTAFEIPEKDWDRSDTRAAGNLRKKLLQTDVGHAYLRGVEAGLNLNEDVAGAGEVLTFLSDAMRGKIPDQFGLDPALDSRIKAAEDMAKHHKLLTDSIELKGDTSFAEALNKARQRANAGEKEAVNG